MNLKLIEFFYTLIYFIGLPALEEAMREALRKYKKVKKRKIKNWNLSYKTYIKLNICSIVIKI
jgi:hypothetical protein